MTATSDGNQRLGRVFVLVFGWKLALFLFAALPVPVNDGFFYDGGVVNWLLHGRYFNPSLAINYPISGRQLFSAYPPLYQVALAGWMAVGGTSVLSAMALHLTLFGLYMMALFGVCRRLSLPSWSVGLGGAFLLSINFHDRPDSLAYVLGMFAVYCWVRSDDTLDTGSGRGTRSERWQWAMSGLVVLCLATSLQIGATYGFLVGTGILVSARTSGRRLPVAPLAGMVVVPLILAGGAIAFFPLFCRGFVESASKTSLFTGLHLPNFVTVLKIVRTVPGVFAVGLVAVYGIWRGVIRGRPWNGTGIVGLVSALTAFGVTWASLFAVAPNTVMIANHLQPLVVACCLALLAPMRKNIVRWRLMKAFWIFLVGLTAIRAVGLSTWGLACAADFGYAKSMRLVGTELAQMKPGQTVVLSGCYLYQAAGYKDLRWIHADHPGKRDRTGKDMELPALMTLQPDRLILTSFDYYRRYEPAVNTLKARADLTEVRVIQVAKMPTPDSIAWTQRIVQHLAWAPVIVEFIWKPAGESPSAMPP